MDNASFGPEIISKKSTSSIFSEDDWSIVLKEEPLHDPKPLIERSTVFMVGFVIFVLAIIWPPLILLVTYMASILMPYSFRVNDSAVARRKLLDKFEKEDTISASMREIPDNVNIVNGYWTNSRGSLMYYTILTPKTQPIKAVVCHCHGYLDTATYTKRKELTRMPQRGIAVIMVDYEGHGRSDGTLGLIVDWNLLVNDVHSFFKEITQKEFPGKKVFLIGESMGGAVAYTIIKAHPDVYAGVNFVAPMCKIAQGMMPPQWVIDLCRKLAGPTGKVTAIGYLPIAPSKGDLKMLTFKLAHKRALCSRAPSIFARKPRFATARELLNATKAISESLGEFSAPFLVQHGNADKVTDPNLSQALYDESISTDKTIQLYDGMCHALTSGEPSENIDIVFNDTIEWILARATDEKKCK